MVFETPQCIAVIQAAPLFLRLTTNASLLRPKGPTAIYTEALCLLLDVISPLWAIDMHEQHSQ